MPCHAWTCSGEGPRPWFIIKSWAHLCSKRVYCPNLVGFSPGKFCQCVENWPQTNSFPSPTFTLFLTLIWIFLFPHLFLLISLEIQGFWGAIISAHANMMGRVWYLLLSGGWEETFPQSCCIRKPDIIFFFNVWQKQHQVCFGGVYRRDSACVTV